MRERSSSGSGHNDGTVSSAAGEGLPLGDGELAVSTFALVVDTIIALRRNGYRVVLVTSGAVGAGCRQLGFHERPMRIGKGRERRANIRRIQALAAVGQGLLMKAWSDLFQMAGVTVAQVLLTSGDLGSYYQYENAQNTLEELLELNVVPIINENDTVATDELRYGDNDWLSALVSCAVGAKWLFLLTDVNQLFDQDPRNNPDAKPINVVKNLDELTAKTDSASGGTQWGTGGMSTKITAARLATAAGVKVCVLHGRHPHRILHFVNDKPERLGTVFEPHDTLKNKSRKRWIANCLPPEGRLLIDDGAVVAVKHHNSLFAVGIKEVDGDFDSNSTVKICNLKGVEVARGISNYPSDTLNRIKGLRTSEIFQAMGEPVADEVIHRNNLALLSGSTAQDS